MRRRQAPLGERAPVVSYKIVRVVPILLAGCVGYLLGNAHIGDFHGADLSAAEAVALRFPQDVRNASVTTAVALRSAATKVHSQGSAIVADVTAPLRDAQRALLEPMPIMPTMVRADQSAIAPAKCRWLRRKMPARSPRQPSMPSRQLRAIRWFQRLRRSRHKAPLSPAPPAAKVAVVTPRRPAGRTAAGLCAQ